MSENGLIEVTSEDLNIELTNQGAQATGSNPIKVTFTASKRQYTINTTNRTKNSLMSL